MGLGSILGKLFGSSAVENAQAEEPVEHQGLLVVAEPIKEGNQYRTAGFIEKRDGDAVQRVQFIRADNHTTRESAVTHSVQKGKQIIDEQGVAVLQRDHA